MVDVDFCLFVSDAHSKTAADYVREADKATDVSTALSFLNAADELYDLQLKALHAAATQLHQQQATELNAYAFQGDVS